MGTVDGSFPLYDLARWINGLAFRQQDFTDSGDPIIKIAELKNGVTAETKLTSATFDPRYRVRAGDLLYSWSGSPETSLDAFWWSGQEGWLNQHIFRIEPRSVVSGEYLYYLLKALRSRLVAIARDKQTTGLGHVTQQDLRRLVVNIPARDDQDKVVGVLGALDDRIELNQRMSETLEALAQASYNLLRRSSHGVGRLGDMLELAYGKALKASDRKLGSVPVYGSNGIVGRHDEALSPGPGIVVGRKGNPGVVTWAEEPFFAIDTTFYVVPRLGEASLVHLYFALRKADLPSFAADSAVPGLNRNIAYGLEIELPEAEALRRFDGVVSPLFAKKAMNNRESRTLAELRDALLPKLISGELRVRDVDAIAESADL
ncbi:MAG: restriction endonuclease subunit S [Mycobacteriales bacterium]